MSTVLKTEFSKRLVNPDESISGADVGPRSALEKLRRMFISKRRDSESSTDIDRQKKQRVGFAIWEKGSLGVFLT